MIANFDAVETAILCNIASRRTRPKSCKGATTSEQKIAESDNLDAADGDQARSIPLWKNADVSDDHATDVGAILRLTGKGWHMPPYMPPWVAIRAWNTMDAPTGIPATMSITAAAVVKPLTAWMLPSCAHAMPAPSALFFIIVLTLSADGRAPFS